MLAKLLWLPMRKLLKIIKLDLRLRTHYLIQLLWRDLINQIHLALNSRWLKCFVSHISWPFLFKAWASVIWVVDVFNNIQHFFIASLVRLCGYHKVRVHCMRVILIFFFVRDRRLLFLNRIFLLNIHHGDVWLILGTGGYINSGGFGGFDPADVIIGVVLNYLQVGMMGLLRNIILVAHGVRDLFQIIQDGRVTLLLAWVPRGGGWVCVFN